MTGPTEMEEAMPTRVAVIVVDRHGRTEVRAIPCPPPLGRLVADAVANVLRRLRAGVRASTT